MLTNKDHHAVKELYQTYLHKHLYPEHVVDFASNFILDLINAFGEKLDQDKPLQSDWIQFAPFEFLLALNQIVTKYIDSGADLSCLEESEKFLLHDTQILLSGIISSGIASHPDSYPEEDHFQLPEWVIIDLKKLAGL